MIIPTIFLICALTEPSLNFNHPMMANMSDYSSEVNAIKDFIKKHVPSAEIVITPKDQDMPGWEKFPLRWREMQVWIRRKPVNDKRVSA